jgi:predicted cupin superfamily sugar epimerase
VLTAEELIKLLKLVPLPQEGGYFRETYRAPAQLPSAALPPGYGSPRSLATSIFYLLTSEPDSFSALHRVRGDEVFHFYLGDPVEMFLLHSPGSSTRVVLGPELRRGHLLQFVVPGGTWQGARVIPRRYRFALLGTTMAPGFDPRDFELAERDRLLHEFPQAAHIIRSLTRA